MVMFPYEKRLAIADLDVLIGQYEKSLEHCDDIPDMRLLMDARLLRMKALRRWLARDGLQVPSRARGRREAR